MEEKCWLVGLENGTREKGVGWLVGSESGRGGKTLIQNQKTSWHVQRGEVLSSGFCMVLLLYH